MQRISLLSLALGAGLGCASITDFDVERSIAEQRIPGNPLAGLLEDLFAVPIPMDVDVAAETRARDSGPAKSARLKELILKITDSAAPAGDRDDFGFLDTVDVFIESRREDTRLPRTLVAQVSDVGPVPRLDFELVPAVDVLPYANEGARLTSEVQGRVPPDDVSFDGQFTLRIDLF